MNQKSDPQSSDSVYLEILSWGLLRIRNLCDDQKWNHVRTEAEHLHNIPSLIGEKNVHRHIYYFREERDRYLKQMALELPDLMSDDPVRIYEPLWERLRCLMMQNFGVRL